jgi:hypothetical protein
MFLLLTANPVSCSRNPNKRMGIPAAELVVRIEKEYDAARAQFGTG